MSKIWIDIETLLDSKIESLVLSNRAMHYLKDNQINTISDFIALDEEILNSFAGVGNKSKKEILDIIDRIEKYSFSDFKNTESFIINTDIFTVAEYAFNKKLKLSENRIIESTEVSVTDLGLSSWTTKVLLKKDIKNLYSICIYNASEFRKIKNLGEASFKEILEAIKLFINLNSNLNNFNSKLEAFNCNEYLSDYIRIKNLGKKYIKDIDSSIPDFDYFSNFLKQPSIKKIFAEHFNAFLNNYEIFFADDLKILLPSILSNYNSLAIITAVDKKLIEPTSNGYTKRLLSFEEYSQTIKYSKASEYITKRANNYTLEMIAKEEDLTRERVRQIIFKGISSRPLLKEDKYLEIFETYYFTQENLKYIFNLNNYSYVYLNFAANRKGKIPLTEILNDNNVLFDAEIKRKIEEIKFRNYISIGDEKILLKTENIIEYILRTKCGNDVSIEQFFSIYSNFVKEFNLDNSFIITKPYIKSNLSLRSDVLWKNGKILRYYIISDTDFEKLLFKIKIRELKNIEISTNYFMLHFPEVMKEYDIRDEYELHNLLKKKINEDEYDLKFSRMPHLIFGKGNRGHQVFDLLIKEAPISSLEFAEKYESIYGVHSSTVLANYIKCIDEYLINGIYEITRADLTIEEFDFLKYTLTKDIYSISKIRYIFKLKFPESDINLINSYNIKRLGFKICQNVLFRAETNNFDKFIRDYVSSQAVINFEDDKDLFQNSTFNISLTNLKKSYLLVEYSPFLYITQKELISIGISLDLINDYCNKICTFTTNEAFSLSSRQKQGFNHELYNSEFGDLFFISLLKASPYCENIRIGNNYIFQSGGRAFNFDSFITEYASQKCPIDIYDFTEAINKTFDLTVEVNKIKASIKSSCLYYSEVMEKIYLNKNQYYEEF